MIRFKWLITILVVIAVTLLAGCGSEGDSHHEASRVTTGSTEKDRLEDSIDSLLHAVSNSDELAAALGTIDSLEAAGSLSELEAEFWRGIGYSLHDRSRSAELSWKKVLNAPEALDAELRTYSKAAASLAGLLVNKGDYEEALKVALPAVARLQDQGEDYQLVMAILYESIGRCQLNLGYDSDAADSYNRAYAIHYDRAMKDNTGADLRHAIISSFNTSLSYITARRYQEALRWAERTDTILDRFSYMPLASHALTDMLHARIYINKAIAYEGLGQSGEAAAAYRKYQSTDYGKTPEGGIDATKYLVAAKRYTEAADNYGALDDVLAAWGYELSMNNVQAFLFPKFRANVGAGRRDAAIAVGMQILDVIDSALLSAKKADAAELAAIYETQQKETEIERQKALIASQDAQLFRQRMLGLVVAVLLILGALAVYTILHVRSSRRLDSALHQLQEAHADLQAAYAELQSTTDVKEQMERELYIARDIQMSMVPSVFPKREGLDLYAQMAPARQVGGDLYSYLLLEDGKAGADDAPAKGGLLYFVIGDVSGKGVPASLFMAQATRLFRTFATQRMRPAQIAQQMNAALSGEDNVNGMFVTLFIGMLDLATGSLRYCNAGHNPPIVVGGTFVAEYLNMKSNVPLGLWPDYEFEEESMTAVKGTSMFLYTDGLTEAENARQEQFGEYRLLSIFRSQHFETSQQVIRHLQTAVEKHRNGVEPNDDLTMMCLFFN